MYFKSNTVKNENIQEWIDVRRDIHANPELRFEEFRTSGLITQKLKDLGLEVTTGLGKTGVVGLLRGTLAPGRESHSKRKMIGLRADMDALPIQEKNDFPHRSKTFGRMHACGHDGHVAMLLAAAQALSENPEFAGDVAFIFQPAEEGGAGAQRMIEDGLFTQFPCDAVFAMHNWPGLETGKFGIHHGPVMASSNEFQITIRGKGAHAAMPDLGIDPVVISAQLINAFQTIISRQLRPVDPGVISVTQVQAGDAINVIPETATLKGTVRTFSESVLDLIESRMHEMAQSICKAFGAMCEFQFERSYPPTVNTLEMSKLVESTLIENFGAAAVLNTLDPTMGAEDFAFMLKQKPGAYFWIGNGPGDHRLQGHGLGPCMLHNPSYDFNDQLLPIGARVWYALVNSFFNSN